MLVKKNANKKSEDFFWVMVFFAIIVAILSGVTSCLLVLPPGTKCNLVTPVLKNDFGARIILLKVC
ncbi:MAG: hypothetical protein WBD50_05470 [Candidatus Rhabdochlamydia sp.]